MRGRWLINNFLLVGYTAITIAMMAVIIGALIYLASLIAPLIARQRKMESRRIFHCVAECSLSHYIGEKS